MPKSHPFRVVVLGDDNEPKRTIYRSQHFAATLSFLSRNLGERPNLDIWRRDATDGVDKPIRWEFDPGFVEDQRIAKAVDQLVAHVTAVS